MNILKNKFLWLAPIVILIVLGIFALAFYPAFNPKPKELPIAIVNKDKGTSIQDKKIDIGKKLEDKLTDSDSDTVKWKSVDSEKKAKDGLNEQKYYGMIVLEKDFSKHAMSKAQKVVMSAKQQEMKDKVKSGDIPPEKAKQMKEKMQQQGGNNDVKVEKAHVKTLVNDGANKQASQIASQVLSGVGTNINKQITQQATSMLGNQDVKVSPKDINGLTNPVKVSDSKIHEVKDHQGGGNAPFLMFMPVWMSSIIASVLLYYAFRTSNNVSIANRVKASLLQMLFAVITAFVGGFGYIYFMSGVLGFDFPHTARMALFISITILGFIALVLGSMTVLTMLVVPIFFLAMFFSIQLVMFPKEMLPKFYQDYIVSWNPFTHYATSVREILYMNQPLTLNSTTWMLIGFMIYGVVMILVATIIKKHSDKRTEIPS
ncbi:ABC transporter permease [Staphylococcus sp. SQ8-PEA]|uniref:ABC transporter permease n=1 Tax=Staphylococcus marylandisciuri TaxID=2981529 RepID=A0ABT2QMQ9_9STAP|nr:ABC transporter permease [Staphylococcus marylandisciuri]MCU5745276.1 ABC transporter permease [Staphylococcus marylandisciuri]